MKKSALAALTALTLFASIPSHAVETSSDRKLTGAQVMKLCNSWSSEGGAQCAMTTLGVIDAINYVALMAPGMKYDGAGDWCISFTPDEIEGLIGKIKSHYKTDDIYKNSPFTFLVISTLKANYACRKVSRH